MKDDGDQTRRGWTRARPGNDQGPRAAGERGSVGLRRPSRVTPDSESGEVGRHTFPRTVLRTSARNQRRSLPADPVGHRAGPILSDTSVRPRRRLIALAAVCLRRKLAILRLNTLPPPSRTLATRHCLVRHRVRRRAVDSREVEQDAPTSPPMCLGCVEQRPAEVQWKSYDEASAR